jgi:ribulose 1,5-bisphosphate synthetase/thiazole synthase
MNAAEPLLPPPEIRTAWAALPAAASVDVLVVGGGPAGCAAAIAAAREGAQTLLVEQFGFLGGMGTAGLVPAWCPFTDGQRCITCGVGFEILEEMKAGMPHIKHDHYDWVPIDAELLKTVYERRVDEAGARILYLTHFVDAVCGLVRGRGGEQVGPRADGHTARPSYISASPLHLAGAIIHNKTGLQRIDARVIVDCTGDADVAAAAGCEFEKGDPASGEMQPCTMCFILAGVDNSVLQPWLWADGARNLLLKPAIAAAKAAGDLNIIEEAANVAYQSESTIGFNFSHVFDVDATDAEQLSNAMIEGRRLIRHLTNFVRKYLPGCANAYLVHSGVQIGVRETRRIIGDYVLTLADYLARRSFDDEIARNAYYIDIHLSKREWERNMGRQIDWESEIHRYKPGESHGVPYRCLIPRTTDNLLVAGRSISTDRAVQGSTRVMPTCLATGEAAGCAAALAAQRHDGDVRALDVRRLRTLLRQRGAYLPDVPSDDGR